MSALITPADRIFVAGHRGMAGSAMKTYLEAAYVERLQKRKRRAARLAALTRG